MAATRTGRGWAIDGADPWQRRGGTIAFETATTPPLDMRWLQRALNLVLGRNLTVDGAAGGQTRAALRDFQASRGLVADGVSGPRTLEALQAALLDSPPGSQPCADVRRPAEELVGFAFDDHRLQPAHLRQVGRIAHCVAAGPVRSVRIVGHTDPVGDDSYNLTLGLRRAEEVARLLKVAIDKRSAGAAARIAFDVDTRGEAEQIGRSAEQNRRVEVFVPLGAPPAPPRPAPPRPAPPRPAPPRPVPRRPAPPRPAPPSPPPGPARRSPFTLPPDPANMRPPARQLVRADVLFPADRVIATMADLLTTVAARPDGWAYLANWHAEHDLRLPLPGGGTLTDRLRTVATRGGTIRGLFWSGALPNFVIPPRLRPFIPKRIIDAIELAIADVFRPLLAAMSVNRRTVAFVNSLARAAARTDDSTLPFGSHHHKILVVGNREQTVAVVGGVDWNSDRLRVLQPGTPLFDVSMRFDGPAGADVAAAFEDRWNADPARAAIPLPTRVTPVLPDPQGGPSVQIGVNYGCGRPFTRIPRAIVGASELIENLLRNCREFFYLECQYGIGNSNLRSAINTAFENGARFGIVVLAGSANVSDFPEVDFRRHQFWSTFPQIDRNLLVFERWGDDGTVSGPHAYVHSKLVLVDDRALSVGTLNLSRRSFRHDSEVTGVIAEAPQIIRNARVNLWPHHLTLTPGDDIRDPNAAFAIWRAVHSGARPMPRIKPRRFAGVAAPRRVIDVASLLPFLPPSLVGPIQARVNSVLDDLFNIVLDPVGPATCTPPPPRAIT